jgi:hypothetical protein
MLNLILNLYINESDTIFNIDVYDLVGKKVYTQNGVNSNNHTIDLNNLNSGIYFVELTTNSNSKAIKKLIIK